MKYKTRNYVASQMVKDYEKPVGKNNRLVFDCPIQRPEGQWGNKDQSLLIHSMLQEYPVPNVYIVQNGADDFEPMTVLDGKQRLTITYNYVTGGFKLSKATPPVAVVVPDVDEYGNIVKDENGITKTHIDYVEIKNKKFSQLPREFQDKIKNFEFTTIMITEATKRELEELMFRLNNGKSMSAIHKAVMKGGIDVADVVRKRILGNNFFSNRFVMTASQEKGGEDMKCAFCVLALLTGSDFNKLTSSDLTKIAENLRDNWENNKLTEFDIEYCNNLLEDLNLWLPDEETFDGKKILTSVHIPILAMNTEKAKQMMDDGELTMEQYKDFLKYWVTTGFNSSEYTKFSEGSPSDKKNVEARIDIMEKELCRFIGLETENDDDNAEDNTYVVSLEEAPVALREFSENIMENSNVALQTYTLINKKCPYNAIDSKTLENVVEWYKTKGDEGELREIKDVALETELAGIPVMDNNFPFYAYAYSLCQEYGDAVKFENWLMHFGKDGFAEIDVNIINPCSNAAVSQKQSLIRQNIYRYACEINKDNEGDDTNV